MSNQSAPDSSVNPDAYALAKEVASAIPTETATAIGAIDSISHRGWEIAPLRWNEVSGGTYDFWDRTNLWLTTDGLMVRWSVGWYGDSDERFEDLKIAEPNDILVLDQLWRDEVIPWEGPSGGTNHFRGHSGPPFRPEYEAVREALESLRTRAGDGSPKA
ncbi:MAG: hypothetical protein ABL886_10670 [Rhodoglobus sp.]